MSWETGDGKLTLQAPLIVTTTNNGLNSVYNTSQDETLSIQDQSFSVAGKHGAYTFNSKGMCTGFDATHSAIAGTGGVVAVDGFTIGGDGAGAGTALEVLSLTPGATGNVSIMRSQTIATTTLTTLLGDNTDAAFPNVTNAAYGSGTGIYTVPRTGYYDISNTTSWALVGAAAGIRTTRMLLTNSLATDKVIAQPTDAAETGAAAGNLIQLKLWLTAGDTFYFDVLQGSGSNCVATQVLSIIYLGQTQ